MLERIYQTCPQGKLPGKQISGEEAGEGLAKGFKRLDCCGSSERGRGLNLDWHGQWMGIVRTNPMFMSISHTVLLPAAHVRPH